MRGRTEPPGGWGWKLQPRQGTPGSGLWVEKEGKLRGVRGWCESRGEEMGLRGLEEDWGEASVPTEPVLAPGQRPAQREPGGPPQPHVRALIQEGVCVCVCVCVCTRVHACVPV